MKPYSVNLWGSHPDEDNDDCWTGEDFETLEEAEKCFEDPWTVFNRSHEDTSTAWIILDGPDMHKERKNPGYNPKDDDDDDWRREIAMQAGMAFGCQGYNDAMGYDVERSDE